MAAAGVAAVAGSACGGGAAARSVPLATSAPGVTAQVAPPAASLPDADLKRYQRFRAAAVGGPPVVLVYHDVQPRPEPPYTVSPRQLASHVAMLRAAGFTPVSVAQVVAWLNGRPLPPRAVMLTFDDSTKGTWIYGDPILAAAGFRAVSFVITGWVGIRQPYYLTWDELQRMQASGRWDLQSHSRLGHQRLPIDGSGATAPALINRLWLPDAHRIETLDEFTARVRADLAGSKTDLVDHGLPEPQLFAYPFSAAAGPTDDPAAAGRTAAIVRDLFAAGLVDSATATASGPADVRARLLRRVDVGTATTTDQLFDLVTASVPAALTSTRPFTLPGRWVDHSGAPVEAGAFAAGQLRLDPGPGGWQGADFDSARSTEWAGYRVRVRVGGLAVPGAGGFGGVRLLTGDPSQIQVAVSGDWVSIRQGVGADEREVLEAPIAPSSAHELSVSIGAGDAGVAVDGAVIAQVPVDGEATGGVGVMARREGPTSPVAVLSDLEVEPG
ncbi:MAG: polysaccharide deacetylase family protein [Solirubrobacteraceae bacterium]